MTQTIVYRLVDHTGRLLYVGITSSIQTRLAEHQLHQSWWPEVATITTEVHEDHRSAIAAEREAIQQEQPAFNVLHSGWTWKDRRRATTEPINSIELGDDPLEVVRIATDEWRREQTRHLATVQAAFDAGWNRDELAKAAGFTSRDGLYKYLHRNRQGANAAPYKCPLCQLPYWTERTCPGKWDHATGVFSPHDPVPAVVPTIDAERPPPMTSSVEDVMRERYHERYPFGPSRLGALGKAVHHIDGDPTNNDPSNLQIVDLNENTATQEQQS